MLRASAVCEAAGFPSSSLVCEGFIRQAAATSVGLGLPDIPVAFVPGHTGAQSKEELRRNILEVTVEKVIANLSRAPGSAEESKREPGARDIVFKGGFDAVNRYFVDNEFSDGLPIVPPTREKVQAFLGFTDRLPSAASGGCTCATSPASCCTRTTRRPSAIPGAWCWRKTRRF
ncbi:MAG: hypothetical protein HY527_10640 [Betaproteobacteria bacterium]|nr:hypothetical protein [Betaproteobacteria bacterium]